MEEKDNKKQREEETPRPPRRDDEGDGMPRFSFMWVYILASNV